MRDHGFQRGDHHVLASGFAHHVERGLLRISAGNYGGKLGPFHFHLHKLMGEQA